MSRNKIFCAICLFVAVVSMVLLCAVVSLADGASLPYGKEDEVEMQGLFYVAARTNLCALASCTEKHPMQGFDVYDGVAFVTYDGGSVITYDMDSGKELSRFLMGCSISHEHHCGNAAFGSVKYHPDDRFPLLYSSGDLSTKACYVERILTDENGTPVASELVQWINFDLGEYAGENGAQAVIDPHGARIIYQQRKLNSIKKIDNAFVVGEFPLPDVHDGEVSASGYLVVNYGIADLLTPVYELPYFSPVYQGADYYEDLLLQSHGAAANSFGSYTGIMVYDYTSAEHTFSRYINLSGIIGKHEPQGVAVSDGRLFITYLTPKACLFEIKLNVEVDTEYKLGCVGNEDELWNLLSLAVEKSLMDKGEDVCVSDVEIKSFEDGSFFADVILKTPYTYQTVRVEGEASRHIFDNYISDGNAACESDGTKTALCSLGCGTADTVADAGSATGHSWLDATYEQPSMCKDCLMESGEPLQKCEEPEEPEKRSVFPCVLSVGLIAACIAGFTVVLVKKRK